MNPSSLSVLRKLFNAKNTCSCFSTLVSLLVLICLWITPLSITADEEYVHLNKIVAKLSQDEVAIGTWMSSMSYFSAMGLVASNGEHDAQSALSTPMIDYVLIDMEHQPFDVEKLTVLLMAFQSKAEVISKGNLQPNISPLVRIPCDAGGPIEPYIKQALDAGAYGIVVPHCRNAEEAERVVSACRYPQGDNALRPEPEGKRGASPWPCSYLWGLSLEDYVKRADVWPLDPKGDILAIIMIEDIEGKDNIKDILEVPGIGAVIFGPYDYSFSCGVPGQVTAEPVLKAQKAVADACKQRGIPFVAFANPENTETLIKDGHTMLLSDSDIRPSGVVTGVIEKVKAMK